MLALAPTPLSPPVPPAEIELTWRAPEGCPSGEEIIARYEALLSTSPEGQGLMEADALITADEAGAWRLELVTRMGGYTDVRKLRAARCDELGEAVAMLFAVALEPTLDEPARSKPPEPPDDEEPPPPPSTPPPAEVAVVVTTPPAKRETTPPKRRPLHASLAVGPEFGAVPGVSLRASAGLAYSLRRVRFASELLWIAPRGVPGAFGPAVIQVAAGTVRACGVPQVKRWAFPVCLGGEAGATIARVGRVDGRRTLVGGWFAPLVRGSAVHRWDRIGAVIGIEAAGPSFSAIVQVDDESTFESTVGSIRGLVGLELYFF